LVYRDWTYLRRLVVYYDKGRCQICGLDNESLYHAVIRKVQSTDPANVVWQAYLNRLGLGDRRTLLEAHHMKPQSEGGKHTLDNVQTLCFWCHFRHHHGKESDKPGPFDVYPFV
jgi:hypothetical protein